MHKGNVENNKQQKDNRYDMPHENTPYSSNWMGTVAVENKRKI